MRRASRFSAVTAAITASTCGGGPAITVWRGEAYTATVTSRWSAISASVASASNSSSAIAPCPASRASNRDRVAITASPSARVSAPATTAALTSPIECPITASGTPRRNATTRSTPTERPPAPAAIRSIPITGSPADSTSCSENPVCATKSGSNSATAAANAGSSANNRRPIPAHCEP